MTTETLPMTETESKYKPLPLPPFYEDEDTSKLGSIRIPAYQALAAESEVWKKQHNIQPTTERRICVVPVDAQISYLLDDAIANPGALDAAHRAVKWGYQWMHMIDMWAPVMDTRTVHQISHEKFLVDENGNHPNLSTIIREEEIGTKWQINPEVIRAVFPDITESRLVRGHIYTRQYLRWYINCLKKNGLDFIVKPYHGTIGGIEHALLPALHELIFFSEVTRSYDRFVSIKGGGNLSEHNVPQEPLVTQDHLGRMIAWPDASLTDFLLQYTYIVVWGSSSSHNLKWFMEKLINDVKNKDPILLRNIYVLKGCTTPARAVKDAEGNMVVDYPMIAENAFAAFAAEGVNIIDDETIPLDKWPNMFLDMGEAQEAQPIEQNEQSDMGEAQEAQPIEQNEQSEDEGPDDGDESPSEASE